LLYFFFFQAEDGIRDFHVTGVQTCALPISAVEAARKAFEEWRDVPVTRRQNVMFEFRRIVSDRRRQLAEVITSEHGKTVPDALGDRKSVVEGKSGGARRGRTMEQ